MAGERIYLDYNATAPLAPGVREAVCAALDLAGNPSSVHREGRAAKALIESAREQVAALAGVSARRVTFTSGATEAANLALSPELLPGGGDAMLLIAAGEHTCVMEGHRFAANSVRVLPLDADGSLDMAALQAALAECGARRPVLALQAANNETGVIQPVRAAAELVHTADGLVVCDAVQAVHRMEYGPDEMGADVMFFSAHKMGGPKGAGALVLVNGRLEISSPVLRGGGQERGVRAGTENVAAIAGFGAAAEMVLATRTQSASVQAGLRDAFENGLKAIAGDVTIFGEKADRLCNTSAFAMEGLTAETMLIGLDLEGVAISSGSACSSGKVRPSHVLESMGVPPDLSRCALRVSVGPQTDMEGISRALVAFERVTARMNARRIKPAA